MAQMFLSNNSPFTYVWHENGGQHMPTNDQRVTLHLSTSGVTLDIADNTELNEPIILINSATLQNRSQNLINIGKNSKVQVIEYLLADDRGANNQVETVINCAHGATLQHCIIQHAAIASEITQTIGTTIRQASASVVSSHLFGFGGASSTINLRVELREAGAQCEIGYLAYAVGKEVNNASINIEHLHPECTSTSVARSVLKDQANTDFLGKIIVHPGASKTVADLQIKNLLCSPGAQAVNKPELEIYNDDVRCSHGSSTGQVDRDSLFYMQCRGIDPTTAVGMLISGFIQPVIVGCKIPYITEYINTIISER